MALTDNIKITILPDITYRDRQVAAGAIKFFAGAICNKNAAGFAVLGSDTVGETFAGIAFDALDQAAGGVDGDNSLKTIAAKSGVAVKLALTGVTLADVGSDAFVVDDGEVSLSTTNSIRVGTIFDVSATNEAIIVLD